MVQYRYKELGLISIQTISNIITSIQFGFIPLEFMSWEPQPFSQVFTAPFDLIDRFKKIQSPIRAIITSIGVFSIIGFLYNIFFQPSWQFFIFFIDLFLPGTFFYGLIIIIKKYNEQQKSGIIMIIIGSVYFILRIISFIFPFLKQKNRKWYMNNSNLISYVFLSRLKKDKNKEELDQITHKIHHEIDKHENSIQFDDIHFPLKYKIIDFCISFFIWIFLLIFVIVGWKKIFLKQYKGKQLDDISFVFNTVTYILFSGISLRIIINIIWLIQPINNTVYKLFNKIKNISYKGITFITSVSLFPILKMSLLSISIVEITCGYYKYYDTRSNTETFLQYFIERDGPVCVNCSKTSANFVYPCNQICYYDLYNSISYFVTMGSRQITQDEMLSTYLVPILFLTLFYLSIFNFILRGIYSNILDILTVIPAPTRNIECKFQTLLNTLTTPCINIFRSFRYKTSLYYFNFTEAKLLVMFLVNCVNFNIIPIDFLKENSITFIGWLFTLTDLIIAVTQLFTNPYVSVLHNIVNFVSYLISGLASIYVSLHSSFIIDSNDIVTNFFLVVIIVAPILTALIVPFFAKKDPILAPTEFDLIKLEKWDKKLAQLIRFKIDKLKAELAKKNRKKEKSENENSDDFNFDNDGILIQEEPSIQVLYYENQEDNNREHDELIGQFDLLKLSPIAIQEGINYYESQQNNDIFDQNFRRNSCNKWCKHDINEIEFDYAKNEMINSSNKIIDCVAFNSLLKLIHFGIIFSSSCLGCCLSLGIIRWKKTIRQNVNDYYYYLRCNMFPNGTYPDFGTYK